MWPKFAVFYGNGSVVEGGGEGEETVELRLRLPRSWVEAPSDDVQAVVVENPYTCRYVWRDSDFYYWVPDGEACSADSLDAYLRGHLAGVFKFGLCIPEQQYAAVLQAVKQYRRIPRECVRKPPPDEDL